MDQLKADMKNTSPDIQQKEAGGRATNPRVEALLNQIHLTSAIHEHVFVNLPKAVEINASILP